MKNIPCFFKGKEKGKKALTKRAKWVKTFEEKQCQGGLVHE